MEEGMQIVSGDVAFAFGAIAAGVSLVTGYPGSPSSGTLSALWNMPEANHIQATWAVNELVAMEMVTGASIAGRRALLCVKSVGLNVALDPLMTMVLTGNKAGLVILLGDDPGSWASQNEQDTRLLSVLASIPLLEPATPQEAQDTLIEAFELSEQYGTPVIVREIRALALAKGPVQRAPARPAVVLPYVREPDVWISWPGNVVENHRKLYGKLRSIREKFEQSALNRVEGEGDVGLVACGNTYLKLHETLGADILSRFLVLKLGTFNPMPPDFVGRFLSQVETVLVFEENESYVEQKLPALAYDMGLRATILGRDTGHLPVGGELDAGQIIAAIAELRPDLTKALPVPEGQARAMPSQNPLCPNCPYIPLFETHLECIEAIGGRDQTIIVGEPSCMVKACRPPYEMLDIKYSLGASIGLGVGLAMAQPGPKVIALAGDSSFMHHSWGSLIEAVRTQVNLLVILLDNSVTAMSGRQPHAGTPFNARQAKTPALDVEQLVRAIGAPHITVIDPFNRAQSRQVIADSLQSRGLDVVISRSPCTRMAESE